MAGLGDLAEQAEHAHRLLIAELEALLANACEGRRLGQRVNRTDRRAQDRARQLGDILGTPFTEQGGARVPGARPGER